MKRGASMKKQVQPASFLTTLAFRLFFKQRSDRTGLSGEGRMPMASRLKPGCLLTGVRQRTLPGRSSSRAAACPLPSSGAIASS
jgi:hypothetical protein